jgi:UDP-glucose 4-epimerase
VCEEIAAFYYSRHGICTIAYRLGMFVTESFVGYGFRRLKGGGDDRDVAQAFLLGLDDTPVTFDAFNVMAEVPFSTEEFSQWSRQPENFLEERYPGVTRPVEEQGADFGELVRMWGFTYWSIEKAKRYSGTGPATTSPSSSRPSREGIGHTTPTRTSRGGASSEMGDLGSPRTETDSGFMSQ